MTTQEASKILKMLLGYLKGEIEPPKQETIEEARAFEQQGYECLEMAIKALEQQPCEDWYDVPSNEMTLEQARQAVKDLRKKLAEYLEQQPCEDAVSRQAVIKLLSYDWANRPAHKAVESIRNLPSVTPKEKIGHWINAKVGKLFPSNDYKCSECGNLLDFDGVNCGRGDANYCPNCGARMVSE